MIIAIASGKGGTGKTSVAVNMALSAGEIQLLDCDVEEPNAHLLVHPKIQSKKPVFSSVPVVNKDLCNNCGECAKFCQYNAIFVTPLEALVFPELCHSCGGCAQVCPRNAISWEQHKIGALYLGTKGNLHLVYGELEIGKPMAVPVIKAVKKQTNKGKEVILDSPPGTSCPFVETVRGCDFSVLVTEPTPFGLFDLRIAVEVLRRMSIPFGIVVNRSGIGDRRLYEYCEEEDIRILLEIPYQRRIAELYSQGIPFSLKIPEWKSKFSDLFNEIKTVVGK